MSEETVQELVETITPSAKEVKYVFGEDGHIELTQKPLSFFGKIELIGVLGGAVDRALADGGISVGELLEEGGFDETSDTDTLIRTIARVTTYAPDLLKDIYVISLGVPANQRDYVKSVMELSEDEGGLSDDQGFQILETFVDQNWDVMVDFFKQRILPLVNRLTNRVPESESSKPLKATARRTPKQ